MFAFSPSSSSVAGGMVFVGGNVSTVSGFFVATVMTGASVSLMGAAAAVGAGTGTQMVGIGGSGVGGGVVVVVVVVVAQLGSMAIGRKYPL